MNSIQSVSGKLDIQTGKLRIMLCDFRKKSSELKQCQKDMIKNKSFDCSCMVSKVIELRNCSLHCHIRSLTIESDAYLEQQCKQE